MMTFTVTYHNKEGLRTDECFEAESRDSLFKLLDAKGIKAIRVENGGSPKRPRSKKSVLPWILAAGAVVLVGGVWWFATRDNRPEPIQEAKPRPTKIKNAPVAPKPVAVREVAPEPTKGLPWPEKSPHPDGEWRHGEGPRSIAVTNGCLVTYPHCPGVQMVLPHPAFAAPFETLLDNEIARIVSAQSGDAFIDVPLPKNFDEKFAESLLVKIEIKDDDPPEKAELKRQVLEARKFLVEAVKRGESPREILIEEAKTLRQLMQKRDNFQRIVDEQIQNGASDQDINDTVNAANKMLEREGINGKVMLPWKTKLRLQRGKEDGTIAD